MDSYSFELSTSPSEQWAMLTKGYTNKLPHAINEKIDNAFMAFLSMLLMTAMEISLVIEQLASGYSISFSDSGPGIERDQFPQTLSVGKAKRNGLNEHGLGLKNVLAFCCPTNEHWEIISRPANSTTTYKVSAPWGSPMKCEIVGNDEHPYASGVTIRMKVPDGVMKFYTGASSRGRPRLETIVQRLRHIIGVTYALHPLMNHPKRMMSFKINGELVRPELPQYAVKKKEWHLTQSLMEGTPPVTIDIIHYHLQKPNDDASEYYKKNQETSGAYIRIFGRLIKRISPAVLYDVSNHNDFNSFVLDVNITLPYTKESPTELDGIPPTVTTKNGFIESDVRTQNLMDLLRTTVPVANARETNAEGDDRAEAELSREFKTRRMQMSGDFGEGYSIQENKKVELPDGQLSPPFDALETFQSHYKLYEFKKGDSLSCDHVMELWRNYRIARRALPDKPFKCILVSHAIEPTYHAKLMIDDLRLTDPSFDLELKRWSDYGIGRYS
jgi:hypothetical protein